MPASRGVAAFGWRLRASETLLRRHRCLAEQAGRRFAARAGLRRAAGSGKLRGNARPDNPQVAQRRHRLRRALRRCLTSDAGQPRHPAQCQLHQHRQQCREQWQRRRREHAASSAAASCSSRRRLRAAVNACNASLLRSAFSRYPSRQFFVFSLRRERSSSDGGAVAPPPAPAPISLVRTAQLAVLDRLPDSTARRPARMCIAQLPPHNERITPVCGAMPRAARAAAAQAAACHQARKSARAKRVREAKTARPGRGNQILRTNYARLPPQLQGPNAVLARQTTRRHRFLDPQARTRASTKSLRHHLARTRSH